MEWKLERCAARKVKTDEDVLWEKIMKALGTDLRQIRKQSFQTLTKGNSDTELLGGNTSQVENQGFPITESPPLTCGPEVLPRTECGSQSEKDSLTPGKTSYSQFKSCIVKKLASQIPFASSPISRRWQQPCTRNQAEQTFAESLPTSDDGHDLTMPAGKIMTIPVSSKIEAPINEPTTFTGANNLHERCKTKKQKCLHQMLITEGNQHGNPEKEGIRICEKRKCLWKGCKDGRKSECDVRDISAHAKGCPPLEPDTMFHITGLRNDYYLNILDWSNRNLIALALESAVHIWNGERNQHVDNIDMCSSSKYIASVAWMREKAYLAVGTSDGDMQLWDIETQKRLRNMFGHISVVGAMSWNGCMLSSGSRLGYIYHHDVRVQDHVGMVRQSKQSVCSLLWSPDSKLLACGSSDGLLNVWTNDLGVTMQCRTLTSILQSSAVKAIMWCPWQSAVIATGGGMKDQFLHIWNVSNMECLEAANTKSQVCSLLWLPKTKELVTGQGYPWNKMNVWKYPILSNTAELYGHKGRVLHMALSPEGNRIFSAAADETAYIWKHRM
ncbi:cell division cycle protein 20 homolog B [Rhineura floridana]|uniref:cell division cycle protein 20 homolog B n=1 Tax=Rhineura floridana TaxID=261503 RepID=UPI002AC88232|nr:cell division cycle protein 20 homolog B [Rhineura floridana]